MTVQPKADPPQAETGADQGKSDNESTENRTALSEITDPRVDRKEQRNLFLAISFPTHLVF
jgi:hypothetical protein